MSGRKSVSVVAAATLVALTLPSSGAPPTADEIFQTLGYSAAERERLQRGEIVSHAVGELSDEELALTMAVIAPAPLERLLDLATSDQIIRANRDIIAFGRLKSSDEASFASVGFDASEGAEVRALIEAAPGSKLNLGDGEIARFAELRRRFPAVPCDRDPACTAAVTQEYRAGSPGSRRTPARGAGDPTPAPPCGRRRPR
jgi:hypothetical protein